MFSLKSKYQSKQKAKDTQSKQKDTPVEYKILESHSSATSSAEKKHILQQLEDDKKWYTKAPIIIIFAIFLFIFIYASYSMSVDGSIIKDAQGLNKDEFFARYGTDIRGIEKAYVINMIICIVSLLVIVYFIFKSIPYNSPVMYFLTQDIAAFVVGIAILALSSSTLNVYNNFQGPLRNGNDNHYKSESEINLERIEGIKQTNIVILVGATIVTLFYGYKILDDAGVIDDLKKKL